jgi:hypothetical protein
MRTIDPTLPMQSANWINRNLGVHPYLLQQLALCGKVRYHTDPVKFPRQTFNVADVKRWLEEETAKNERFAIAK